MRKENFTSLPQAQPPAAPSLYPRSPVPSAGRRLILTQIETPAAPGAAAACLLSRTRPPPAAGGRARTCRAPSALPCARLLRPPTPRSWSRLSEPEGARVVPAQMALCTAAQLLDPPLTQAKRFATFAFIPSRRASQKGLRFPPGRGMTLGGVEPPRPRAARSRWGLGRTSYCTPSIIFRNSAGKRGTACQGSPRDAEPCAGAQCPGTSEAGPGIWPHRGRACAVSDKLHKTTGAPCKPAGGTGSGDAQPRPKAGRPRGAQLHWRPAPHAPPRLCPRRPAFPQPSPSKSMRPSLFLSPSFIRDSISSSVTCSPEALKISASSSASM